MKITRNTREYERFPANGIIRYKLDPNSNQYQIYNILEISEGGLSFLTLSKTEPGTTLGISILLFARENPISMNATVVRCPLYNKKMLTYRACLRFLNLVPDDQKALRDTLHRLFKSKAKKYVVRLHD